ncbi:hypothetical protein ACU635_43190 [[Actinomadura] parvosata]|uniref:hypothetical protein n=1 Tax=[Actinomadura] parvosata TaxID=1955412 RepID=UPI00406D1318
MFMDDPGPDLDFTRESVTLDADHESAEALPDEVKDVIRSIITSLATGDGPGYVQAILQGDHGVEVSLETVVAFFPEGDPRITFNY